MTNTQAVQALAAIGTIVATLAVIAIIAWMIAPTVERYWCRRHPSAGPLDRTTPGQRGRR